MENIGTISESVRQQLINLENVRTGIHELKTKTDAEDNLKQRIEKMLSTALADLLICSDFLFEAESCIDESDLEFLLEVSSETEDYN
jgi:hypothetical protein